MQDTQKDEPEYIVVPLEAQVAMSTFLYTKWQENVGKRLDKYLTFPQWLQTLERSPHQLEEVQTNDRVTILDFHFATIEWHFRDWQLGATAVIGNEYTTFEISLLFFTLIWITENASATTK